MTLKAGDALWGGEDIVQKRADEAEDTLTNILKFYSTRVQLEEKYAKSLGTITSKVKSEGGTVGPGWLSVRDQQNQQLSANYAQSTSKISGEIVTPLDASKKKYSSDKSRLSTEIAALKKEMKRWTNELNEKKQSYWSSCETHYKEKKKLDAAPSDMNPTKLQKLQSAEQKAKAEMDKAEKEYRDNLSEYNSNKAKYEVSMKAALEEYEKNDLERSYAIRDVLQKYVDHTEANCREQQAFFKACREQLVQISTSKDLSDFLGTVKGIVPPEPDQYEEYETEAVRNAKESRVDGAAEEQPTYAYYGLPKYDVPVPELFVFASALYDFNGTEENELRFRKMDILIIKHQDSSGWWVGELFGREGLFPASYVKIMENRENLPKRWPPPGHRSCTAKGTFTSPEPELLSFDENETLVITEEYQEWYIGENGTGMVGMFAKEFVILNG
mmetsp:Transcript_1668/g.2253  ORF Transcript_1668/g.2253 Transcript_1668/m.2253 type:complete len:443 (+) Transcript_1668:262-1590(+)|eukprot:CAMPEP_0201490410 /NCGR_PEP_ID=MMETSP0151_2-20130828/26538_1 /ASSEMBLY_ACC=CAM_ASM_000257 /TAXON_ID=200890 /ORGANISM="Paramoeba atlantica, Strain 621/1 / CCAP 1560/9" /LENGTH=442 /DNA_ID=CAMNT_0047876373 /DNA_START=249 /DNA_END=1577 /DNA_ORIENTATION=+